ncbi:MAG: hypothetical protein EPO26_12075 [Chloroflexota bacterium]|nr:MAG: hypothetical protein EPO26_12075 [Chloroflexota bacterium]
MSASRGVVHLVTTLDIPAHRWRSAVVAAGYTCAIAPTLRRPDGQSFVTPDLLVLGPDVPGAVALALIDAIESASPDRKAPAVIRLSTERTDDVRGADGEYVIAADAHTGALCALALALWPQPTEVSRRSWLIRFWERWRRGATGAFERPVRATAIPVLESDAGPYS